MTGVPDVAFIVGGVIAVLGGLIVASYLSSSPRHHRCRWSPVAVSNVRSAPFTPEETAVLKRCARCGDLQSTTLVGSWTFAQVIGLDAEAGAAAGIAAEDTAQ
ncbi:hypothetical protein GBF35_25730 [Nonomuraea phyllanthi]|uniref:hypothetical protein n=1 Tax=Nonomuraea phyllanthi TaxID=2219224 RepID=UPI00129360C9|nr:hypothetical protein [Nonomuraea phyllanthi]QFY09600.1 hypothetical protein GBF35_25730 [Nonomuraea phyllanthi]